MRKENVITAVRVFYNQIPMILSIILFAAFVTTFRLDREMRDLGGEAGKTGNGC